MGFSPFAGFTVAYDVTAQYYGHCPAGQRCGYTTGSPEIAWLNSMWIANPGAVRICQDYGLTDFTADVADVERGAGTPAQAAAWAKKALAAFLANVRPGQRRPAIYCSASTVTDVVNALLAARVTGGVGLWIADWNLSQASAIADLIAAAGPFPVIGVQFTDAAVFYDNNVFSTVWLSDQSGIQGSTVSQGSSGPAVLAAQKLLNIWGAGILADGLFGQITLGAVRGFQSTEQLVVDGVIGSATWKQLEGYNPAPSADPNWTFSPVQSLKLIVGRTSVRAVFTAPAGYMSNPPQNLPGVAKYEWAASEGTVLGPNIPSYPRFLRKGSNPEVWQEGGFLPGKTYTSGWRAELEDGSHSSEWVTTTFTMP